MTADDISFKLRASPRLRTLVAERIRNAISTNRFPPGTRLVERELCELIGVSRTSVREALRELESEGLISTEGGRPIVSILSEQEVRDIYEVRVAMESLASRLFIQNATPEHFKNLQEAAKELYAAMENYEIASFLAAKTKFYEALFAGAGNQVAAGFLRVMHTKVSQLRAASLANNSRAQASIREIRKLVAAIKARDEDRAAALTVEHIRNASQAAVSAMQKGEAS